MSLQKYLQDKLKTNEISRSDQKHNIQVYVIEKYLTLDPTEH